MTTKYHECPCSLTAQNIKSLAKGKTVQLKHHQIAHGKTHKHKLVLPKKTITKVNRASRNQKGVRLTLAPHEIEGSGILDFFKTIGNNLVKNVKWVKDKVIDTDFYQQNLRPLAKQVVNQAYDSVIRPVIPSALGDKGKELVNTIGDKTGAFGLYSGAPKVFHFTSQDGTPSASELAKLHRMTGAPYEPMHPVKPKKHKKKKSGNGFTLAGS